MSAQLEAEKRLTGNASASTLWKELVTIPGNRKRAIISVLLMVCQQMTGLFLPLSLTSVRTMTSSPLRGQALIDSDLQVSYVLS